MMQKSHRTWLITGASSGFGRSMTEKLLARGDDVIATVRKMSALDDLAEQYGESLTVEYLDVSHMAEVRSVVDRMFRAKGHIDVVVSNAGYGLFGAAEEFSDEQIRQQIETNVLGSIQLIRASLPHLRAQGGGRVLQVSSEGGQIAYPTFSLYHASKWAIEGFVESVAQEVAGFHIEFSIVEPGPTKTGFREGLVQPVETLSAYDQTPVGAMRRTFSEGGFARPGDVSKMVDAMIVCAEQAVMPKRLVLGGGPYQRIRAALQARLKELESQREIAESTDIAVIAA
jgi:NAD(P)-dependent dehydrogenase (short-subunit alcohol dehydrogenase family)